MTIRELGLIPIECNTVGNGFPQLFGMISSDGKNYNLVTLIYSSALELTVEPAGIHKPNCNKWFS